MLIDHEDLSSSPSDALLADQPSGGVRLVLRDMLATFEKDLIVTVLAAAGGSQKRAAKALGVLPTTFQEKLKRFGLLNTRPPAAPRRRPRNRLPVRAKSTDESALSPQPSERILTEDQE